MSSLTQRSALPKGWRLARFDEVLHRVERKIIVEDADYYNCVGVRWYGLGAFIRENLLGMNITRKQQWVIKSGDVVYNKLFAWKNAFAIVDDAVDDCIVSDKFPTYEVDESKLKPKFLYYYFRTANLGRQALALSKGGAAISKLTLNPPQFWDLIIPLPPPEEQQRIVARIEELAAKIKAARGWRREAVEEGETLIDSVLHEILETNAKNSNWKHDKIPEFIEVNPSRKGKTDFSQLMPVSFVPMAAVDDKTGQILAPETKPFIEVSKGYSMFVENDVIFARITPCMQNGKAALAKNLVNGVGFGSTEFYVLRPGPEVLGEWLHRLVRHKDFRDDAEAHMKGTAGQQRVQQSFFMQKQIPVPPLEEQQGIVTYLDELQAKVDTMKRIQAETSAELDALLPSILDKAFEGEL